MKQNIPIKSKLKAKRIKWGDSQNVISWAYMKMLREHHDTRKIYEINPYVEVYQFRDNLNLLVKRLDEFDHVFPSHFMVDLENRVLVDELNACNEILVDPENCDFKALGVAPDTGIPRERMFKYIQGFSCIAYTMEGVYRPK